MIVNFRTFDGKTLWKFSNLLQFFLTETMETSNTAVEGSPIKFDHLLLIWIAILALIVACLVFLLWKATQKSKILYR